MTRDVLRLVQGTKVVGGRPVLDATNLTIAAGESLAVIGRSGSGKSTLLSVLGLLDDLTDGERWLWGERIEALGERDRAVLRARRLGFVFQNFRLIDYLTAASNVAVPMDAAGHLKPVQRRRRADDLLGELGLAHLRRRRPRELSGGEQQRVAIARALACEPDLLLADEPTGSLDEATAADVLRLLRQATHERGCALLVVTHDPGVAAQMGTVRELADGRLHEVSGTRAERTERAERAGPSVEVVP
ncbi:ABC transporter ATP-binding protein [Microbacterium sp. T2.11-28]|uniref:ABC transporter ATP-binding protein n=1 Tax=Microbacterium sp. T2.11-28 TaxID=3041169 RepID=UPI0024775F60|nr:ABC transporter ATP-binding protein [Microbacterium sp. T2.11-28]CAI9392887.1 Lipoprotein-releasing system ATP-binding protein LolD [Microbacterium sp. T2.11-28]